MMSRKTMSDRMRNMRSRFKLVALITNSRSGIYGNVRKLFALLEAV